MIIANNVLAHVPELNDVVAGMATLLADDGLITVENPWVKPLVDDCEFDTIYHEHFCYYSCTSIERLMRRHGLHLDHVEQLPRAARRHAALAPRIAGRGPDSAGLLSFLADERAAGIDRFDYYARFAERVRRVAWSCASLLSATWSAAAPSSPATGRRPRESTMLNHVGLGTDLVSFVVDRNPHKQGRHMPGTHQPILDPSVLVERRPDYLLLLAWNFADEIIGQQAAYAAAGGRFIVPVPEPRVLP